MSFNNYYDGRRVLVTGHTGFKGAWLTLWLKWLGAKVCGISLPPETTPNLFDLARVAEGIESHHADIRDGGAVKTLLHRFAPEIVFHLAAQPFVRRSYHQPVETFATNVMGTIHVLEAVRTAPSVKTVVVVTSDKVYENRNTGRAFQVGDPLGGDDPYSASKGCTEGAVHCWRQSFFSRPDAARIASVRAGNVFGGGDWGEDRLVPDIARAIAAGHEVVLRNPGYTRPWQHVLDVSAGYLMLGARMADPAAGFDAAWNFGPLTEEAVTVGDFARRIIDAWKEGDVVERPDANAPKESKLLRLDASDTAKRLGWRPLLGLDEAIDWTVAWYATVQKNPEAAPELSVNQLAGYQNRLNGAAGRDR